MKRIAMGGGCHWCTEAVFQSLKGVLEVEQGYLASTGEASDFSEGVIVSYDPECITLGTLIEIHLHTHESTSNHSFRKKYRSAVYYMHPEDETHAADIIGELQEEFDEKIITQVLPFAEFEASRESLHDYYRSNPERPFCQRYIDPKLQLLMRRFGSFLLKSQEARG